MTSIDFELPIVGMFHHPPAIALGRLLPLNANLWLRAEPENAYDSNAIAVDLDLDLLNLNRKPALRREIKDAFDQYRARHSDGPTFENANRLGTFHLGYLAATDALKIKANFPDFDCAMGTLRFGTKAKPLVRFGTRGRIECHD